MAHSTIAFTPLARNIAVALFVFSLFNTALPLHATDVIIPRFEIFYAPEEPNTGYEGLPVSLDFAIRNNNVLPAEQYTIGVSISPAFGSTPLFSTTFLDNDTLHPFVSRDYNKPSLWTPSVAGQYKLTLYVDYEFDIDRSNDTVSTTFTVFPGNRTIGSYLNRITRERHISPFSDTLGIVGFVQPEPLPAGTVISFGDSILPTITLDKTAWLGFLDYDWHSFFNHPAKLFVVGAHDSLQTDTVPIISWPLINGASFAPDPLDSSHRFFGTPPTLYSGDTNSIFLISTTIATATDSTCAILVSGVGQDNPDQAGLNNNIRRMRRELTADSLGPRLPDNRVQTLFNPTADSLVAVLEGLANKYTKLYFFFSGHGDSSGYGVLRDNARLYYESLLEALFMSGARDLCIIVESCYSGKLIDGARELLEDNEEYRNLNITILTSSDSRKTSKKITTPVAGGYVTYGEYTLALTRCMGNPDANTDGVPGVSLAEAHAWLRQVNPTLQSGGTIDSVMNPRIWVHRSRQAGQAGNISFPDANIDFTPQQGILPQTTFTVTMDPSPFALLPTDTTVFSVSPGRQWLLEVTPSNPFSIDARFYLEAVYDTIDTQGMPGIAYRTAGSNVWQAHYPTVWDSTNRTLTAMGVSTLGSWAVGAVREQSSTSVQEQTRWSTLSTIDKTWPNPFVSATTIRFVCRQAGALRLSVVNALGTTVYELASGYYAPGVYYAVFNGEGMENGMYYSRLEAGGAVVTRPLVLTK